MRFAQFIHPVSLTFWRVIGCYNVLQIPGPLLVDGETYHPGEWMDVEQYMELLGITSAELLTGWAGQRVIPLYASKLHAATAFIPGLQLSDQYAVNLRRAATYIGPLLNSFRQVFKIDPYFIDRISTWQATLSGVVSNFGKQLAPSPVYADYLMAMLNEFPLIKLGKVPDIRQSINWKVSRVDPLRDQATIAYIQVLDQQLGVFKIAYVGDYQGLYVSIIPSAATEESEPKLTTYTTNTAITNTLLSQIELDPTFTMETIVSIIWDVDKDNNFSHDKIDAQGVTDYTEKYYIKNYAYAGQYKTNYFKFKWIRRIEYNQS